MSFVVRYLSLMILVMTLSLPARAEESINIKMLAVNPSDTKELTTTIEHPLPPEIRPEDVINDAGMDIVYNQDERRYFAKMDVVLAPMEQRQLIISVRNVWALDDEELEAVRGKIEGELSSLIGTKYYETAKLLTEKALARVDLMEEEQSRPTTVRQQIELYRSHKKQLEDLSGGILSLDAMRQSTGDAEAIRTASFVIRAENPSSEPRKMLVRSELPKDVQGKDILDKGDFSMLFDSNLEQFVLEREDQFAGGEKKSYKIVVRDIWHIPDAELERIKTQTEKLVSQFEDSPYESFSIQASGFIYKGVTEIRALQEEVVEAQSIEERMRAFVLNSQKLKLVEKKFRELQDLVLEIPLEKAQSNLFQKILRGVAEVQKVEVGEIFSMGVDPDISTTWWVIFGIIIFLAIIAVGFYLTWLMKMKANLYEKKQSEVAAAEAKALNEASPEAPQKKT